MAAKQRGLGRGLGALIRDAAPAAPAAEPAAPVAGEEAKAAAVRKVPVAAVRPSPWQPRRTFSAEALAELASSVKERGVLQPLLVRRSGEGYELIAGERRLRAAGAAGLAEVPVIVMEAADHDALELALIENVQREDLNVIEEAEAYRALGETFSLTQEQIADRVGKARVSVTNTLRLLNLDPAVRQMVAEGRLSAGHAKVLLGVPIPEEQRALAAQTAEQGLSVRDLERVLERRSRPPRSRSTVAEIDLPAAHLASLSDQLHRHFGTSARIIPSRKLANGKHTKGRIELDFYSNDELDRILQVLGLAEG